MKRDTNEFRIYDASRPEQENNTLPYEPFHRTGDVFVPPHIENDPLESMPAEPAKRRKRLVKKKRRPGNLARRRKQIRRRRRRLVMAGAAVLVFLIWLFLRLAPVSFGSVTVDGNDAMTTEDVYHSSGIYGYINVVQLSPDEMQRRLSQDLRIASVSVSREFPAAIHVRVSERQPAAVVTTMYGFAYVDKNGIVMDIQPRIKGISVPILTGKRVDTLLLGEDISDSAIQASLAFLQYLSPDTAPLIAEINVGNSENIIAYTSDSLPIHLGTGDHPAERADITSELLGQVRDRHMDVQYIDTNIQSPLVKEK